MHQAVTKPPPVLRPVDSTSDTTICEERLVKRHPRCPPIRLKATLPPLPEDHPMPHCLCLVTTCAHGAAVAASVRLRGVPTAWLLCDEHAAMLDHPSLPAWCEVDHVRPVADLYRVEAQELVRA